MANSTPQLRTPGIIAAELEAPLSRVLYILRTRCNLIKPVARAGCLRLYDRAAVEAVRDAIRQMDKRQGVVQ